MSFLRSSLFRLVFCVFLSNVGYPHPSAHCAQPDSKKDCFGYLRRYPETLGRMGDATSGEIEITLDVQTIADIEKRTGRQVGVVAEDRYWIWLNDAVKFPNGKSGVYGRLIWRVSLAGNGAVVILPMLPNGKVCLNRNFRHATRSWEYELPRGGIEENETAEAAAVRELKEETGLVADQFQFLGVLNPDSGTTNSVVSVFLAKILWQEDSKPEDSEAIAAVEAFSIEEIKKGFIDGYLSVEIDGKTHRTYLRDPFLAFALFQAELRRYTKSHEK